MENPSKLPDRYQYEVAKVIIDEFVQDIDMPGFTRAWHLALRIINVYGLTDNEGEEKVLSRARAWEDWEMACKGQGQPAITGSILQMYSNLPEEFDERFKAILERAFATAGMASDPTLRRYAPEGRSRPVHVLSDGFALPEAVPLSKRERERVMKDAEAHFVKVSKQFELDEEGKPILEVIQGGLNVVDDDDDYDA
jgi:hypothetical protein